MNTSRKRVNNTEITREEKSSCKDSWEREEGIEVHANDTGPAELPNV